MKNGLRVLGSIALSAALTMGVFPGVNRAMGEEVIIVLVECGGTCLDDKGNARCARLSSECTSGSCLCDDNNASCECT